MQYEKLATEELTKAQEEAAAVEAERLIQEQGRLTAQQEYIAWVEEEYSSTNEAKLEQLREELELIEESIDWYGGLKDEQETLIDIKKEEIAALEELMGIRQEDLESEVTVFDEKVAMARSYALLRSAIRQEQLDEESNAAEKEKALNIERAASWAGLYGAMSDLLSAFSDESQGIFIAMQALASAEAAVNSYLAFTQVLADKTLSTWVKPAAAATILASGLAAQAKIWKQSYEDGGIVPGTSYSGDNVAANVNSGEMILNDEQQANLFEMANGLGGGGTTTIKLQLPTGKTFATWVVDAINAGQGGVISSRVIK